MHSRPRVCLHRDEIPIPVYLTQPTFCLSKLLRASFHRYERRLMAVKFTIYHVRIRRLKGEIT